MDQNRTIVRFGPEALGQLETVCARLLGQARTGTPGAAKPKDKDNPEAKKQESRTQRILEAGFGRLDTGISRLTAGLTGGAIGLATRGFSGTADAARLSYSLELLSRQFSAVFQPIMGAFIYASNRLTLAMQSLNGSQQNRLMNTVLGGAAGLAFGGPLGGAVGGFLGNQFGGGTGGSGANQTSLLAGIGVGAYVGGRIGGLGGAALGAIGGAAAGGGIGDYYEAARRTTTSSGRKLSKVEAGLAAIGMTEFYAMDQAAQSLLGGLGLKDPADMKNLVPTPDDAARAVANFDKRTGGKLDARREPQVSFTPAEEEAGSAANRFQQGVALATSGMSADPGPFKPIVDLLAQILLVLSGKTIAEASQILEDTAQKARSR